MGGDFDKGGFSKSPLPHCKSCGMSTKAGPVRVAESSSVIIDDRVPSKKKEGHAWCERCKHWTDVDGDCVTQNVRRCISCQGRPKCSNCGRMSSEWDGATEGIPDFGCDNCNHNLDDDGDCKDDPCRSCNPIICNECDSRLEGELDEDDEIYCDTCEHSVDQDGDCMTTNRTHCDTCDSYPDCPGCGADTYHEDSDDDDDDDEDSGDYYCEDECSHTLDYDGNCESVSEGKPCSDCNSECSSCGCYGPCDNGSSCEYKREGECRYCHCYDDDDDPPDCPDCGDSNDVEGPDGDGDYWCNYSECDSSNYFS